MLKEFVKLGQLRLWQAYCQEQRAKHPLTYLFWETTLRCNLSCRHCGSSCGPRSPVRELSTQEIKDALSTVAADYVAPGIMLAITGGEPLLRPDLFEVVNLAHELGFSWGMVTNGTLVTPEVVAKCKDAGMSTVTVSLDGLKEAHDFIRGKGSFRRAVQGAELVAKAGFPLVQVTTCISQYNFGELEGLHRLVRDLGVDEWRLLTITPIGRARDDPKLLLPPGQLRELLDFIREQRRGLPMGARNIKSPAMAASKPASPPVVLFEEEGFLGPDYEGEVRESYFACYAGVNVGSILADGSIGACPNLPRHLAQGNVRRERFSLVWEKGYQLFRDTSWKRCQRCSSCQWWGFCQGNGLHLWDFERGEPMLCHWRLLRETEGGKGIGDS
ncbi:MAG: radical SAM protein [Chloroflexota bacterium]